MRKNFNFLLKNINGPEKLKKITKKHLDDICSKSCGEIIDARLIARLTMKIFVEFLFDKQWEDRFEILVEAR